MSTTFRQQLDQELLLSERRRTIILIIIFAAAIGLRVINQVFIKADEETLRMDSFSAAWFFPLVLIVFECLSLLHINRCIKSRRKRIPALYQYFNASLEICLPSAIIFYMAKEYTFYDVLHSPAIFIYFIFIILSTLRLNMVLSFFYGFLASVSYAGFSIFLYAHFNTNDAAHTFILLFSGIAAGLVAKQIKQGVNNSLKEAERRHTVENLFGQQISAEVAEKMLENDGKIESKRMQVAVMFVDIRNFTHFAADRKPEEIVKYQNAFLNIVINTVTRHDGIVNQILGDGCMVTFGAPIPTENISQKAVAAAKEILDQIESAVGKGVIYPTRIGIGIHMGEAVTGNIGTATRQQYSITGSVVIMASRIEQLNKEFNSQILVSDDVMHSVTGTAVDTETYEDIILKGFDKPVTIHKVA